MVGVGEFCEPRQRLPLTRPAPAWGAFPLVPALCATFDASNSSCGKTLAKGRRLSNKARRAVMRRVDTLFSDAGVAQG
mgnify:CR=1 FL=1